MCVREREIAREREREGDIDAPGDDPARSDAVRERGREKQQVTSPYVKHKPLLLEMGGACSVCQAGGASGWERALRRPHSL